jgi:hypothetical protein
VGGGKPEEEPHSQGKLSKRRTLLLSWFDSSRLAVNYIHTDYFSLLVQEDNIRAIKATEKN